MQTIPPALQPFCTLDGRLSRHEANAFKLGIYGAGALVFGLFFLSGQMLGGMVPGHGTAIDAAKFMVVLSIVPNVRRLHDRGKSGWWLLVFSGVPWSILGLMVLTTALLPPDPSLALALTVSFGLLAGLVLALGVALWGAIELTLRPGTAGPNRYGPPSEGRLLWLHPIRSVRRLDGSAVPVGASLPR